MRIRLKPDQYQVMSNSGCVFPIIREIFLRNSKFFRTREHLWTMYLNSGNMIIEIQLSSLGTINRTLCEPYEIFSYAIKIRSTKLILIHNHPSGILEPSDGDIDCTDRVLSTGKFLNIRLLDHLIISENAFYSFLDMDLLQKIERDSKYDLSLAHQERVSRDLADYKKVVNREVERLYNEGKTITQISKILNVEYGSIYDMYIEIENSRKSSNIKIPKSSKKKKAVRL